MTVASTPLTLFVSDRARASDGGLGFFDGLVQQLSRLQRERAGAAPKRIPVLINSAQISDRLRLELTRTNGVCMGFEFVTPNEFFGRTLRGADGEARLREACLQWAPAALRWRLLPRIGDVAPQLGFASGAANAIAERERFAAAVLLAQQLDRTLRQRPTWAANWRQGRTMLPAEFAGVEAWQRSLWCDLAGEPGMPPHPAEVLAEIAAPDAPSLSGEPGALVYVATDAIDPLTLQTLQAIASCGWSVQVHAMLPSLGYLGDLPSRLGKRAQWSNASDEIEAGHPLLVSLGQQAIGTFLLLGTVDADYAAWPSQPAEVRPGQPKLLNLLQHDVRSQCTPAPSSRPAIASDDVSLRVHSCHSPRRELEALRDELLRAFADPQLAGLRPEDVVVGVTDFDTYAPLAEAILKRPGKDLPHGLPVRLTSITGREANAVMVALLAILRVATGRQSASELLGLLALEAVQARLGVADDPDGLDHLCRRLRASGLTHGLDQNGGDPTPGTWRVASDRILAGFWLGTEPTVSCPQVEEGWVHPLASALAEDDSRLLGFCDWLHDLRTQLIACTVATRARDWAERLRTLIEKTLSSASFDDEARQCRDVIHELASVQADTTLDSGAIIDWLAPQLENATSLRSSLDGKILVGRLEQVRGLPCRVLAILGLEHGRFPRVGGNPAWDLVGLKPERWDPEPRRRDRQVFLDAILTPTDRLILTAANRNRVTGEDGPFSACVDDLLRAAALAVAPEPGSKHSLEESIVIRHPLQPFAGDYFTPHPEPKLPPSFDAEAAATAAAIAAGVARANHVRSFAPPIDSSGTDASPRTDLPRELRLDLTELISFWRDPAKAWLKAMRAEAPWAEADERTLDDHPIELDGLERYAVASTQMEEALQSAPPHPGLLLSRLVANREMTPGVLGKLHWEFLQQQNRPFLARLVPVYRQSTPRQLEVTLDVADSRLGATRRVTLVGQLRILAGTEAGPPRVLVYRPGKFDSERYQLDAWVRVLLAASANVDSRGAGGVAYGTGPNLERELAVITPEEARQRLGQLVVGYYLGQRNLIAYAPETSGKLAAEPDPEKALEKAAEAWARESSARQGSSPGEGTKPAAMLAWREQNPFSGGASHQWRAWADSVAKPLQEWWRLPAAGSAPAANDAGATAHQSASSKKKAAPTSR